jgi:hypothetical protein
MAEPHSAIVPLTFCEIGSAQVGLVHDDRVKNPKRRQELLELLERPLVRIGIPTSPPGSRRGWLSPGAESRGPGWRAGRD